MFFGYGIDFRSHDLVHGLTQVEQPDRIARSRENLKLEIEPETLTGIVKSVTGQEKDDKSD